MLTSASCFRGQFVLDLQTRRVNRSAISSEAEFTEFRAETNPPPSPMPLEFQSKKPPFPSEFQDAARGMVWIFSGITQ